MEMSDFMRLLYFVRNDTDGKAIELSGKKSSYFESLGLKTPTKL